MMKLIDLLVQELPKRGGWPEGAKVAFQDDDLEVRFMNFESECSTHSDFIASELCSRDGNDVSVAKGIRHAGPVTREQYEVALRASAWNGEGLPLVGCECEWKDDRTNLWVKVKVVYASEWLLVIQDEEETELAVEIYGGERGKEFRTTQSEAEHKREERITTLNNFISGFMKSTDGNYTHLGEAIYEWQNVLDKVKK